MAATTLVTFLLETSHLAGRVELFGSWDNFRRPYPMRQDRKVGHTNWRGCHSFTDIICDGESLQAIGGKRDGGLLMGGKYWYFYRLDDDIEYCNPSEPSTNGCPLLPGQCVNVLEVPIQMASEDGFGEAALLKTCDLAFTLNPEDKYRMRPGEQRPSTPVDSRPASRHSPLLHAAGSGNSQAEAWQPEIPQLDENLLHFNLRSPVPDFSPKLRPRSWHSLPCSRHGSVRSLFDRLRRPRSTADMSRAHGGDRKLSTFSDILDNYTQETVEDDRTIHSYYTDVDENHVDFFGTDDLLDLDDAPPPPLRAPPPPPPLRAPPPPPTLTVDTACSEIAYVVPDAGNSTMKSLIPALDSPEDFLTPSTLPHSHDLGAPELSPSTTNRWHQMSWLNLDDISAEPPDYTLSSPTFSETLIPECPTGDEVGANGPPSHKHRSFISSTRTSGIFSLGSSMSVLTEPSSPIQHPSQPLTPTVDGFFGSPFPQHSPPGLPHATGATDESSARIPPEQRLFPGYSLPVEEHSSAQTIRPQGPDAKTPTADWAGSPAQGAPGADGRTALQEFVDDLGYLGAIIA